MAISKISSLIKTIMGIIGGGTAAVGSVAAGLEMEYTIIIGVVALIFIFFGADKAKEFFAIITGSEDEKRP